MREKFIFTTGESIYCVVHTQCLSHMLRGTRAREPSVLMERVRIRAKFGHRRHRSFAPCSLVPFIDEVDEEASVALLGDSRTSCLGHLFILYNFIRERLLATTCCVDCAYVCKQSPSDHTSAVGRIAKKNMVEAATVQNV
jgi:hypothetical protein